MKEKSTTSDEKSNLSLLISSCESKMEKVSHRQAVIIQQFAREVRYIARAMKKFVGEAR